MAIAETGFYYSFLSLHNNLLSTSGSSINYFTG